MQRREQRYRILRETIETNLYFGLLNGFECEQSVETNILLSWHIDDTLRSSCYGIQYIAPQDIISMKQMFFSQRDKTHLLYTKTEDYSKLCLTCDGTLREDVAFELFMVGFYSYMAKKQTLLINSFSCLL